MVSNKSLARRRVRRALAPILVLALAALTVCGMLLPAGAAGQGTEPESVVTGDGVHRLGLLPSDPTGFKPASIPMGSGEPLAASINLSSQIPPIGNQGNQNSCASWSSSYYYKTWTEKKKDPSRNLADPADQFSPSFVYNQVNGGFDRGSSFASNFTLMQNVGDLSIQEMPYNQADFRTQPTAAQLQAAKQYRISGDWRYLWIQEAERGPFSPPNDINAAKAWLTSGKMLVMAMSIYDDFPDYNGNPTAPYYDYDGTAPYAGGHGVSIVGYNDNINPGGVDADHRGGFLMANSWGPAWNGASNGFVYLSYDYVKRYMSEAWVMNDLAIDSTVWYLAEGSTDWGFSCNIGIINPNSTDVRTKVTYMTSTGAVDGGTLTIKAMSAAVVEPGTVLGAKDFSTKVECIDKKPISVDRNMFFAPPGTDGSVYEAHSSVGVKSPALDWYLAEGSSDWGFESWLLIQNPSSVEANCTVTYMTEDQGPIVKQKNVPANSRKTFGMADDIGNKDASIMVESDVPVIPERAMYRNSRREGHDSIGTMAPATDFYLAEGTTDWGFTTYILVQNPNVAAADVTITYMTPSGPKPQPKFTMSGNSRTTIRVNDIPEVSKTDLSTQVHGSKPIIAERAMYWRGGVDGGEACHDSIGMSEPRMKFFLASGDVGGPRGAETYTLVQNLNTTPVTVKVSYLTSNGEGNIQFTAEIPAQSRKTFDMAASVPVAGHYGVIVESLTAGKPIMVERSMYYAGRAGGTDTIGGCTNQ